MLVVDGGGSMGHALTGGTSLGMAKHDRLIAGGVLGGDAAQHVESVPTKVAMLTLE
jgi:hypothetical protein